MASLLRAYNALLIRRPMASQCATAGFLFGAGDVVAQQLIEKRGKEHDFLRTARLTFYGGALFGPCMTKWYQFLNRLKFSSPRKALIYRVYLDQLLLTPVAVAFFYGSMATLEARPFEAWDRIKKAYIPTIIRNWAVYVPVQLLNFSLVPPHLRLVFVSVVSLFWNTYLSSANSKYEKAHLEQADEKLELNEVD
ncbi:hypothetical protein BDQ17DRAFT_1360096 [Cyathus striatus]|nr:hypothetical protein BDQ17DRAFT_1360096 [Cyathus striatus]